MTVQQLRQLLHLSGLLCSHLSSYTPSPSLSSPLSPQLRVYSWRSVRQQLEESKDCFLEMAVSVSREEKILLPKILDW